MCVTFHRWLLRGGFICAATLTQADPITFETIPGATPAEGLVISDQFLASDGVTFSLSNGDAPVLAEVGGTRTAFQGPGNGSDNPVAGQGIGSFFLTDDGQTSGTTVPTLIVSYAMATQTVSGDILDIDFSESFTITAYDSLFGGSVLETLTINAGDPDTGDGIATGWAISRATADILRLEFAGSRSAAGFFGLGFDNFNSGISPAAVPLPAGLPILLSGLGLLAWLRRKDRV